MTPDQFVTAWQSLLDKGVQVSFNDDMRLYVCHIARYNEAKDEWEDYEASGDINSPNPLALFEECYANMQGGRKSENYG